MLHQKYELHQLLGQPAIFDIHVVIEPFDLNVIWPFNTRFNSSQGVIIGVVL